MAKTLPFTGSAVALVTPFDGNKTNYDALGELIEWHIANSTDAIVICGTTGEASTMPDEEHIAAIEYTVKKAAGRIKVIAGTGSNETAHAIVLSKEAEAVGADGLLQVTPYYNKASQKGRFHFRSDIKGACEDRKYSRYKRSEREYFIYSAGGRAGSGALHILR